jgi:hypothetical protein
MYYSVYNFSQVPYQLIFPHQDLNLCDTLHPLFYPLTLCITLIHGCVCPCPCHSTTLSMEVQTVPPIDSKEWTINSPVHSSTPCSFIITGRLVMSLSSPRSPLSDFPPSLQSCSTKTYFHFVLSLLHFLDRFPFPSPWGIGLLLYHATSLGYVLQHQRRATPTVRYVPLLAVVSIPLRGPPNICLAASVVYSQILWIHWSLIGGKEKKPMGAILKSN